ncbi:MAG TPA: DUF4160 domain-containing protein [Acetobacteraceae bacterium]|nr:DUF4160 domain-containing protein [Acetobacteraceae bacterium]
MPKVAVLPDRLRVCQFHHEHGPPHFHVQRAGHDTLITITDLRILRGALSATDLQTVTNWAFAHQGELALNWLLAQSRLDMRNIPFP